MTTPTLALLISTLHPAQAYGEADTGSPGDAMIQAYLAARAAEIHETFADDLRSPNAWAETRDRYREEYLHMLGLSPLPERTPLHATVTGTIEGDGFVVDMLHYQSRPRLYVTANLYRPAGAREGERLPAVLYVCGHSGMGRNGNKTAFQSHGIWFARHGFVCLVVDTLQLGEIAAIHHGTYREQRWWWHSRGYTSAGVECWNGVRGIDYLVSRDDVDPERIAVTGISGGGAATFWVSAADERVKVAVPVSGMADLPSYVSNRVINGHCDCMFLYNTFRWPWARIAGLIAPRPMLFVNSDRDPIFPMDANERIINRLERLYSQFGSGHLVDSVVSIGGHAYREDIRRAAFRFIRTHLQGDPRPVSDSEVDLVRRSREDSHYPIAPERLRAFPTDADIPRDELNTTIDQHFVPIAEVAPPAAGEFAPWKERLLRELRRVTFGSLPARVNPASDVSGRVLETEPGIRVRLRGPHHGRTAEKGDAAARLVLVVDDPADENAAAGDDAWIERVGSFAGMVFFLEPRGTAGTRWTRKNPPNYVERSHVLLGETVDTGRVRDVIAVARHLRSAHRDHPIAVHVAGRRGGAVLAIHAALLEPEIAGAMLVDPLPTHLDSSAPQLLNVLRVCDVPDALGMLAPRPVIVAGKVDAAFDKSRAIYEAAGAAKRYAMMPSTTRP